MVSVMAVRISGYRALSVVTALAACCGFARAVGHCTFAEKQYCGGRLVDLDGSIRDFDLSSLCRQDGSGYMGQDYIDFTGHRYAANVCGTLADPCFTDQYCDIDNETGPAVCNKDPDATRHGLAKQYNFTESCPDAPNGPCEHCLVLAREPAMGEWGAIEANGVKEDLSQGIQVKYPFVNMTSVQEDHRFGHCGYPQPGRRSVFVFTCDCSQVSTRFVGVFTGPFGDSTAEPSLDTDCQYTLLFESAAACYDGFCSGTSANEEGLSGGSIFLILLAACTIVYLGTALYFGHRDTGVISLPATHVQACGLFCGNVQSGCMYSYAFVMSYLRPQPVRVPGEFLSGENTGLNYT